MPTTMIAPGSRTIYSAAQVWAGRYRRVRELGASLQQRYSRVFLAEDQHMPGQVVALKMLDAANSPANRALGEAFLKREQDILAHIAHPHIPQLRDRFIEEGAPALVFDYIEGCTLEELLACRRGPQPLSFVLAIGVQLCTVLDYLHKNTPPIVHRDLKPANVLLDEAGRVFLIDFGIACFWRSKGAGGDGDTGPACDAHTFKRYGTRGYAPPEQYSQLRPCTPRADLYSLGVILHHMLSGRDPQGKATDALFSFPPLALGEDFVDVSRLVRRLLAREPRRRPRSALEVKHSLEEVLLRIEITPT